MEKAQNASDCSAGNQLSSTVQGKNEQECWGRADSSPAPAATLPA